MTVYVIETRIGEHEWITDEFEAFRSKIGAEMERRKRNGEMRIVEFECTWLREVPESEMDEARKSVEALEKCFQALDCAIK